MRTGVIGGPKGVHMLFGSALLTLIAVATVGYHLYRYAATQSAEAEISAVRPYCRLITCNWGKCGRGRKLACSEVPATLATEQRVRRFQEARLEFTGRDGQKRVAWAEIGTVIQDGVRVGDRASIHFIDHSYAEPEVIARPSLFLTLFGLGVFLFFLSIGAKGRRSRPEPALT